MQFLQNQVGIERTDGQKIQIIVTTHSPNLASAIKLENLVIIQGGKAFPLKAGKTRLEQTDYRFLERFLDVTKANLFFARGVVIVEGDGENILLPTLARLIGNDFAEHGVSVVNVGHTGLRRFARIFQRQDPDRDGVLDVPVACVADLDIMPDCAPVIIGQVNEGDDWPEGRRWRVKSDFNQEQLDARREEIRTRASGQNVDTFVSGEWTLEYDLAYAGLAKDVWIAAWLSREDDNINAGRKTKADVERAAVDAFAALDPDGLSNEELASRVYALFTTGTKASKAIAAQYLSERLETRVEQGNLTADALQESLPEYLKSAIAYVSAAPPPAAEAPAEAAAEA